MGQIVAEQLVEILKSAGVRRVYGVTGCCADSSKSITPHNQWFRCSVKMESIDLSDKSIA